MNSVPLSIESMALLAAARRNTSRENIVQGALTLLDNPETDVRVLLADLSRLVDLKLLHRDEEQMTLTPRALRSLEQNVRRIRRVESACW